MTYPSDLPVPQEDGLYDHLTDFQIPAHINLPVARDPSTTVNLASLPGLTVVFCYPRTGAPDETVPASWNAIPGARGCTPQACSFRDQFSELRRLGVAHVYGISTQSPAYQAEVYNRLHLPYDLLSDQDLTWQRGLDLPTFEWEGTKVLRRSMMAVRDGTVVRWWYPVYPPDKGIEQLMAWLVGR